jgi:hypothetical protein
VNFFSPLEAFSSSVERGVARLSQRAFEGPRRDVPLEAPTPRQLTVKAIVDGEASKDQVKEAFDFGLASRGEDEVLELTPLGEIALSGYPDDRPAKKAAAA